MALASVENPVMTSHRQVGLEPPRLSNHPEPVHPRHLQIGDEQVVAEHAHALDRRTAVGRHVDVVVRERKRFGEEIPDAGFIIDDQNSGPGGRGWSLLSR